MRSVNLIPIDEPAGQEVTLIPVDEGAGNSPFPKVPTGYQPPNRDVVGIASPQDQQAADTFRREYVEKPASNLLARGARAVKLLSFPVAKVMDDISGNDEHQARLAADIDELSGFIKEQQPGPEVGEVGRFVRGVQELAPQIAAGPAGLVNMLATATADKGIDALDQGVDPTTATALAEKQLVETAAFMKIPQTGSTLPRSIAIGAAGNPALGTLGRAADRMILETTGHQQQADAVNVLDPAAMAHEAAMGAMFSVDGHIRNNLARNRQREEQQLTTAPEGREVTLTPVDDAPATPHQPDAPETVFQAQPRPDYVAPPETQPQGAQRSPEGQAHERAQPEIPPPPAATSTPEEHHAANNPLQAAMAAGDAARAEVAIPEPAPADLTENARPRPEEQQRATPAAEREVDLIPLDDAPATPPHPPTPKQPGKQQPRASTK